MEKRLLILTLIICMSFDFVIRRILGDEMKPSTEETLNSGVTGITLGASDPDCSQDSSSSARINNEKNDQIPTDPNIPSSKATFSPSVPSPDDSSTSQSPPISNLPPVESYISEFKTAVYNSKILQNIFDFSELSPEVFSKSLYDYIISNCATVTKGNTHYTASAVSGIVKEGIDTFNLPIMLDIYANTFAKFLFAKGILNSSNASELVEKFAKAVEENAECKWAKETPESKFLVLADGIIDYLKAINKFDLFDDLALQYVDEVKRVVAAF